MRHLDPVFAVDVIGPMPRRLNVLIVQEDSRTQIKIETALRRMQKHEAKFTSATTLAAALFAAASNDFDVVLMDIAIGDESTLEIAQALAGAGIVILVADELPENVTDIAATKGIFAAIPIRNLHPYDLQKTIIQELARKSRSFQEMPPQLTSRAQPKITGRIRCRECPVSGSAAETAILS